MTIQNAIFILPRICLWVSLIFTTDIYAESLNTDANYSIHSLYHNKENIDKLKMSLQLKLFSEPFLGKPYLLGALGEGDKGQFDQFPLYRTDAFDCETFVDTVLALALSNNLSSFQQCINHVRYKKGQVSFLTRNHFTCLDWNKHNQHQGFTKDITLSFVDANQKPLAKFATALIDKPNWYQHFDSSHIRIKNMSSSNKEKLLIQLKQQGKQLPAISSTIPYLPFSVLFNDKGLPIMSIFEKIPDGAIIEIIRPNWNLREKIGTNLNVSHLGFVFWQNGQPIFREASSELSHVVDVPLIDYLSSAQKSPTIKGINIQIVPEEARCNNIKS